MTMHAATEHSSKADRPAGAFWRAAALAWVLVVLAVCVHQFQFWKQGRIDTDVLALLPLNEQAHANDGVQRECPRGEGLRLAAESPDVVDLTVHDFAATGQFLEGL